MRIDPRMRFISDWASKHFDRWQEWLGHLAGKPDVHVAEIGSWEGRSALWFAEHIANGPRSSVTCIDTWKMGWVELHFLNNINRHPAGGRVLPIKGISHSLLEMEPFDAIYVDGDHSYQWVLEDGFHAWQSLMPGGVLIFDDVGDPVYGPEVSRAVRDVLEWIDASGGEYTRLDNRQEWQVAIRKAGGHNHDETLPDGLHHPDNGMGVR